MQIPLVLVRGNSATATRCTGNSATASKLQTARNIKVTGAVNGNANFDGSENIEINTVSNYNKTTLNKTLNGTTINVEIKKSQDIVLVNIEANVRGNGIGTINEFALAFPEWAKPKVKPSSVKVLASVTNTDIQGTSLKRDIRAELWYQASGNLYLAGTFLNQNSESTILRANLAYILD